MTLMMPLVVMKMSEPMWLQGDPFALGMDDDEEELDDGPDRMWGDDE